MHYARAHRLLLLVNKIVSLALSSVKPYLTVAGILRSIFFYLTLPEKSSIHQKYHIEISVFNGCQLFFSSIVFTYFSREDLK